MSFDLYAAIMEHAPNNAAVAAGNLHEEIWTDLLRRNDPNFHNVRVTRGDGGIDGIAFVDPATGEARIYQAKFYKDFKDEAHRAELVDAYIRAHCHQFKCSAWVLLVPQQLSHADLNWLMAEMRVEAAKAVITRPRTHAEVSARIRGCAIEYQDADNLNALLTQHLDIAARHLPRSTLSLMKQLEELRTGHARERAEVHDLLRNLRAEAIRSHQVETRRAHAALSILLQGWSDEIGMLQLALTTGTKLIQKSLREIAEDVKSTAAARAPHAYACEGLVPGASKMVADIHRDAHLLQLASLAMALEAPVPESGSEEVVARRIIERIEELRSTIVRRSALYVENADADGPRERR